MFVLNSDDELRHDCSGATRVMAANNDCVVRTFDAERFSLLTQFTFPWSVNVSAPASALSGAVDLIALPFARELNP